MKALVALGSNLGDRDGNLRRAVALLERAGLRLRAASSIWSTAAVDCADPRRFKNAVIALESGGRPWDLLALLQAIERRMGRVRNGEPNSPRVIDLDLLAMGAYRMRTRALTLPHPRMWQRRFVLVPLAEIAPTLRHPDSGESVGDVAERLRSSEPDVQRDGPLILL